MAILVKMLFIIIDLMGILYFLVSYRTFNFFTVAYLSASVYFLPGVFGYVLYPPYNTQVGLVDSVYIVMISILVSLLVWGVVFELRESKVKHKIIIRGGNSISTLAVVFSIIGLVLTFIFSGKSLFSPDKSTMMVSLDRWYIVWSTCAPLAAVISFQQKQWKLFSVSILCLLLDLYIGFRTSFTITLISLFTFYISQKGKQRFLIKNWFLSVLGLIFAMLLLVFKLFNDAVKIGNWTLVIDYLSNTDTYVRAINESEPFTTQAILNEVITKNFTVDFNHFLGIIYQFILFAPELGAKITSFNDLYQPVLFPGVPWGMANNIWAEMLSSGGWLLLILFINLYCMVLYWSSYLLGLKDPALSGVCTILSCYWAFYIHRNDILYEINLEKRIFIFFVCITLISILLSSLNEKINSKKITHLVFGKR